MKSKFVDMLRNIRNLTERRGHAGSGIRFPPSFNKCRLYRPYEVLMRPCLMRSECLATATRIHSVSDQSNKIPRDDEGRLKGELQESSGSQMSGKSTVCWEGWWEKSHRGRSFQELSPNRMTQASSWSSIQLTWATFSFRNRQTRSKSHSYN